ncbi:jg15150 [Pararge aegeria aegeria]|uniref:Jg15150 protein n=1 Tax=Pararge aegeria aegeria TaxID=348720 RepID=A0A8S4S7P3_9NEOP|nr:jg15150 [Pararge aegeria aegeria]
MRVLFEPRASPMFISIKLILLKAATQIGHGGIHEADVLGCDEPACPYYKKNSRYLMVPARRRRHFNSPTR